MKKLFFAVTLLLFQSVFSAVRIDTTTGKFYSQDAPCDVDQDEYNRLVCDCMQLIKNNPYQNMDLAVFVRLRVIGTPAAMCLICDLEKLHKESMGDLRRTYGY